MTTYCSEQLAFIEGIRLNPKEDVPRLMYADWLDENPEVDPGRAELIRVQCGVASRRSKCCDAEGILYNQFGGKHDCPRCGGTGERNREIIATHDERWRAGPVCGKCGGKGAGYTETDDEGIEWRVNRCTACHGTGDADGLRRKFDYGADNDRVGKYEPVRLTYDRGFIARVTVPTLADCVAEEHRSMHGSTVFTASSRWLRSALTATPERGLITGVVPLDREPQPWHKEIVGIPDSIKGRWFFVFITNLHHPHYLPHCLSRRELWTGDVVWFQGTPTYSTHEAAVTALGEAVAFFSRTK